LEIRKYAALDLYNVTVHEALDALTVGIQRKRVNCGNIQV
jgi:hypothetical protein